MSKLIRHLLAISLLSLVVLPPMVSGEVRRIPVEDFFRNSEFTGFQISPDGNYLTAIGPFRGTQNLFAFDVETLTPVRLTANRRNNVLGAVWASNDRILYFIDNDGNESMGIFAINKDASRPRTLVEPAAARQGTYVFRQTLLLDPLTEDPNGILVMNNDNWVDYPDVYYMNIFTGGKRLVERNPGDVVGWVTDQNGVVRAASFSNRDTNMTGVRFRKDADADWEELARFGDEAPGWTPLAFDFDRARMFVRSNLDEDKAGIYIFDLTSRAMGEQLFRHPKVDAGGVVMSRFHRSMVAVTYNAEKPGWRWFSEEGNDIQKLLDATFPDTINRVVDSSDDATRMVIASSSDRQPVFFHLLDFRGGQLRLIPLGHSRDWIKPEEMAEMRPYWIQTRDEKEMLVYLSLPPNRKEGERVPLILNPHGGPWHRDSWGFDPEVQFLANRGFAVLRVNFRGSTGFGRDFLQASYKRWGLEMQDDLIDAVRWAIDEGYVDPDRIGVMGASYGGYATMMQMVLYPEVYKRGVNIVGVVDLVDQVNHWWNRLRRKEATEFWKRRVGDPDSERELLVEHSPLTHVDKLEGPVFIVHGTLDPRVSIEHATRLRSAMRRLNKPFEWMVKRDEGHGFIKEENRIDLYQKVDAFLAPLHE